MSFWPLAYNRSITKYFRILFRMWAEAHMLNVCAYWQLETFLVIFTVRNSTCGKVMFSQACVKNSVHRWVSASGSRVVSDSGSRGQCLPLGLRGVHPQAETPLGRHLLGRHPLGRHPPGQTPPGQTHPQADTTPRQTPPPGRHHP